MAGNELIPTVGGASVPEQPTPMSRSALMQSIGSGLKLTDEQRRKLVVDAGDNIINIKPTGEIYVPGVHWRTILNQVFDPFGWGTVAGTPQLDLHEKASGGNWRDGDQGKSTMYLDVFLMIARCTRCHRSINGCDCGGPYESYCAQQAMGAADYHPTNSRLALDDARESAITNGLMRCCKVFGIYDNIWSPVVAESAKHRLGVHVNVRQRNNDLKPYWRLLDREPLDGEVGIADDSPNREKYLERWPAKAAGRPQERPAPPKAAEPQQTVVKPTDAAQAPPAASGDKILVIRSVKHANGEFWVLQLDPTGEFIVEDANTVKALENSKARGERIAVVTTEARQTTKGTRKALIEYRVVAQKAAQ